MIDQLLRFALEYGHFVVIGLAVLAFIQRWRGIIHFRDNPPWKTGEDLRGARRGPLTPEEEAEFNLIMAANDETIGEEPKLKRS